MNPVGGEADEPLMVRSADGTPIACWRSGHGPPLVLVHGTAADHTRWAPVLPALQQRFTVWAVDRRGRGASGDAQQYTLEREANDLAAVVDATGGPAAVLGHSYGAMCALEAAIRTPRVASLVLYEPGFTQAWFAPHGLIDQLTALLSAGDRDAVVTTFMREVPRVPPAQLAVMRSQPAWQGRVKGAHTIPRELQGIEAFRFDPSRFRSLTTPTLVLIGGDTPPERQHPARMAADAIPNSRIAVMPGQQHTAMDTAPEMFCTEVISFLLDQHPPPSSS